MLILCHNYFQVTPNNKNVKDGVPQTSKRKYAFGVFLLLLVGVLWVVSSEFTKYLYTEKKIDRPFLVTYVRSSLLFIYLLVLCFTPPTKDPCRPADYTQLLEQTPEAEDENFFNENGNSLGDSTFVPVRAGENTDSDDTAPRAVRFNKVAEVRVMSAAQAGEALLARLSWAASVRATEHAQRRAAAAATRRHLRLALVFCVPWFVSNYLYRVSVFHGASTSSTVYVSSAGALALSLGSGSHLTTDRFNLCKCVGVLLTAAGLVILGISESHQSNWTAVLAALGSALSYAVHLIMFRNELRKGDGINAPLFVGVVGCACGCLAWVFGGILALAGVERATLPPPKMWSWLLIDAALGPLLLETLWLWGRSLTCARTASLCLCVPPALSGVLAAWRGGAGGAAGGAGALGAGGAAGLGAGAALAALGWLAALCPNTFRTFNLSIRNIPGLDEQSEALMSPEEPT